MSAARCISLILLAILGSCLLTNVNGQEIKPFRGIMPNSVQLTSPIDNVEVSSGKVHLSIPLGSLPPGPAGSGFDLDLKYDSRLWDIIPYNFLYYDVNGWPNYMMVGSLTLANNTGGWTYNADNYNIWPDHKANVDEYWIQSDPNLHCDGSDSR